MATLLLGSPLGYPKHYTLNPNGGIIQGYDRDGTGERERESERAREREKERKKERERERDIYICIYL